MKVSYLGPEGTFTNEAAIMFFPTPHADFEALATVSQVLRAVEDRKSINGVVPIENSVQGEVTTTMDSLVFDFQDLLIVGEIILPVTFCALRKPGDMCQFSSIFSHPHALAQCARYIEKAGVPTVASKSTAEACEFIASKGEPGAIAIASRKAGLRYSLEVVAEQIEDFPGAVTRFLVIGTQPFKGSGEAKTTFVIIPKNQHQGVLAEILQTLSDRSIDVYSIHSRPVRRQLGTYCFFLTVSGQLNNSNVFSALSYLIGTGHRIKFLGSYGASPSLTSALRANDISGKFLTTVSQLSTYRTE
jgi:prephenate dehydratase